MGDGNVAGLGVRREIGVRILERVVLGNDTTSWWSFLCLHLAFLLQLGVARSIGCSSSCINSDRKLHHVHCGIPHLQIMPKRLNTSENSSSLCMYWFLHFTLLNKTAIFIFNDGMWMDQYLPNMIKSSSSRTCTSSSPMKFSLPSFFTISTNSILLQTGRAVYGSLKTGLITPNCARAELRHIGFGSSTSNHSMSGISFAFRLGFLPWNISS